MNFIPPLLALTLSAAAGPEPLFVAKTVDDKITIGYGLAIGDVDGDKHPDILLADAKEIVWYHNPDWKKTVIAKNLTPRDNVCIAARDLDGDGKVEIAVGAQWNPAETTNEAESGAIFFLQRPEKPDGEWKPVRLPHEPTTHRMHWVRTGPKQFSLVVLPLHGRGNANGAGLGVNVIAYAFPDKPGDASAWKQTVIDNDMHVTHNFDLRPGDAQDELLIAGKEAVLSAKPNGAGWDSTRLPLTEAGGGPPFGGAGEVRFGPDAGAEHHAVCCIEPFHGPNLSLLEFDAATRSWKRQVLDTTFNEGHALAAGNVLGVDRPQIVAGWRMPNKEKEFGIRIYRQNEGKWRSNWVCAPNSMACEDLKLADLDGDGRPEIIAAGRSTKNVVIYKAK